MNIARKKLRHPMFDYYILRMIGRIVIFAGILFLYFFHREWLTDIVERPFFGHFSPLHILWGLLMGGMILHLLPKSHMTMAGRKSREDTYVERPTYEKLKLLEYVQKMNVRAWTVMLVWICFNAIFGVLYLTDIIGYEELILLSMFYYTSDLICMMVFCPFQKFFMKNRCCVNCRIFDWGHFMMYTPMIFIRSFFSWSLLFTALVVLIRWELTYARHPERFWRGSNATIRCENCQDKTCLLKKPLKNAED